MQEPKFFRIVILSFLLLSLMTGCNKSYDKNIGQTKVSKWKGNKKAAISITYDDGIISQFTVARPMMNKLNLPATFFVLTGKIEGSLDGHFIGRPKDEIILETGMTKTNANNFFERASLIGYTGTSEAMLYHSNAGSIFESGKVAEAYQIVDEAFDKLRNDALKNTDEVVYHDNSQDTTSWGDLRLYADEGHEIASHTITHPRLAVLDEVNLMYELEQSQADIRKYLGEKYTFSVECPYGTEDERVMEYAHQVYPALRNRMPSNYLDEINRSNDQDPKTSENEYVQWQRGPLTNTSMELMKSWVETCLSRDNVWLVLVFHGVDDFGWEPKTAKELEEYFTYIKEREDDIWVATFADVTKYIRERKGVEINSMVNDGSIELSFSSLLDTNVYDVPLTLKTYIPSAWKNVKVISPENNFSFDIEIGSDDLGQYILFDLSLKTDYVIISERL